MRYSWTLSHFTCCSDLINISFCELRFTFSKGNNRGGMAELEIAGQSCNWHKPESSALAASLILLPSFLFFCVTSGYLMLSNQLHGALAPSAGLECRTGTSKIDWQYKEIIIRFSWLNPFFIHISGGVMVYVAEDIIERCLSEWLKTRISFDVVFAAMH